MTALTVSATLARGGLVRWLRRLLPVVGRMAGAVLVVSGAYLVAYWLPALSSGSGRGRAPVSFPDALSGRLSTLLDGHTGLFAALAVVLIAAGVAAGLRTLRRLPDSGGASQPLDDSRSCASPTEAGTRGVVDS